MAIVAKTSTEQIIALTTLSYPQFVLHDVYAPFDPNEDPLWNGPDEDGKPLSVRRTEVAVSLLEDAEVRVHLITHARRPDERTGAWDVIAETRFEVASGVLGVSDVINMDKPKITVVVRAGQICIRVYGRITLAEQDTSVAVEEQVFEVHAWPG
jgi:hypothetical protein